MAKRIMLGVSGKAHKVKKGYFGVSGKAHKVKKGYFGVSGKARQFFSSETSPAPSWLSANNYNSQNTMQISVWNPNRLEGGVHSLIKIPRYIWDYNGGFPHIAIGFNGGFCEITSLNASPHISQIDGYTGSILTDWTYTGNKPSSVVIMVGSGSSAFVDDVRTGTEFDLFTGSVISTFNEYNPNYCYYVRGGSINRRVWKYSDGESTYDNRNVEYELGTGNVYRQTNSNAGINPIDSDGNGYSYAKPSWRKDYGSWICLDYATQSVVKQENHNSGFYVRHQIGCVKK